MTQIFLASTNGIGTDLPDPGNWNPVNLVEAVGCGGTGANGAMDSGGGGGGSGGGYAYANNLTLTFPVRYAIYQSNFSQNIATYFNAPDSNFNNQPAGSVKAENGWNAGGPSQTTMPGGRFWPNGFAGGRSGGSTTQGFGDFGGGGGGAGGPHGAGVNATSSKLGPAVAGNGGAGDNGVGGAGAAGGTTLRGSSGTQWDATHGCGGGGGGAGDPNGGGLGGNYGGGGGGGNSNETASLRLGKQGGSGLIILTYIPVVPPVARVVVMCS